MEADAIWAERGKAIQSHALLEHALNNLFACLTDTEEEVAGTIFHKIASADSRKKIIEQLLRRRHDQKFSLFWNAYLKKLHDVNRSRTEIVHWLSASISRLDEIGTIICAVLLIPPNTHSHGLDITYRTFVDIEAFATQCDELGRLCNIFVRIAKGDTDQFAFDAWFDIFQRPLVYPLPEDHLLYTRCLPYLEPRCDHGFGRLVIALGGQAPERSRPSCVVRA